VSSPSWSAWSKVFWPSAGWERNREWQCARGGHQRSFTPTACCAVVSRSSGLHTAMPPKLMTCVQIIVVVTPKCPRSACIVPMSLPPCSGCVAYQWRRVGRVAGLGTGRPIYAIQGKGPPAPCLQQEQHRQRLPVRGHRHRALHDPVCQQHVDLLLPQLRRIAQAVKADECVASVDIGVLDTAAVVHPPDPLTQPVKQLNRAQRRAVLLLLDRHARVGPRTAIQMTTCGPRTRIFGCCRMHNGSGSLREI
jgi:hypothetical protein